MISSEHERERRKNKDVCGNSSGYDPKYNRFQRNGEFITTSRHRPQTYDTFKRLVDLPDVVPHRHSSNIANNVSLGRELMLRRVPNADLSCCSANREGRSCLNKVVILSDKSGALGPKRGKVYSSIRLPGRDKSGLFLDHWKITVSGN